MSGVDTCKFVFRPTRELFFDRLRAQPHRSGPMGSELFDHRGPGGTRLGAFFGQGIVFCEGRLSAMLSDRADEYSLAAKTGLVHGDQLVSAALRELADGEHMFGRGECEAGELARYDLAFEHQFADGADGLAFLRACGALLVPRRKVDVAHGDDGQVQTVRWRTPKRFEITERIYDKGVESGSHAPGERIRIEVQRRPQKAKRQRASVVADRDLAPEFGRQMKPFVREEVVAAAPKRLVRELWAQAARGERSYARAERLIGTVNALQEFGRAAWPDERMQRRRIADVRSCGVVVDDGLLAAATVPVGQLLREAMEAWSA